jgi:hypothetical protein
MRARTTAGTVTAAAIVVVRVLELMVVGVDEADGINDSIEAGKELDRIPVDERFDAALDVIELNGEFDVLCAAANVVIPVAAIDNHQLSYYKSTSVNGRKLTSRCYPSRRSHLAILAKHVLCGRNLRLVVACRRNLSADEVVVFARAAIAEACIRCHARVVTAARCHRTNNRRYLRLGTCLELVVLRD